MPRNKRAGGPETKRLNLELPEAAYERVKEVERATEAASVSEVLRRSLTLYDYLVQAQQDGKKIVVRDGDHEQEIVMLA